MPRPRAVMRKIREVLRLIVAEGLSRRQVGASVGLPYTTVAHYVERDRRAGVGSPLPEGMDDHELEQRLFAHPAPMPSAMRPVPDWEQVHPWNRRQLLMECRRGAVDRRKSLGVVKPSTDSLDKFLTPECLLIGAR